MESTLRKKLVSKTLSKRFLSNSQEIEQEEMIQAWKHPTEDGYQGLYSFNSLVFSLYKELKLKYVSLPDDLEASKIVSNNYHLDILKYLGSTEASLLASSVLHNYFFGENNNTIREIAKKHNISKSYLGKVFKDLRSDLPQE